LAKTLLIVKNIKMLSSERRFFCWLDWVKKPSNYYLCGSIWKVKAAQKQKMLLVIALFAV
jgi:hypothetical protein